MPRTCIAYSEILKNEKFHALHIIGLNGMKEREMESWRSSIIISFLHVLQLEIIPTLKLK